MKLHRKPQVIAGLLGLGTLISATAPWAHGAHAQTPANSLLHLLAHHWPLLLVAGSLVALAPLLRRSRK